MSAILSSLFGLGVSGLNYLSQQQTNLRNAEMQQRQQHHNVDLWRLNNEYNDPMQQMQRLERAGINPNVLYGQGASGASGISSSPAQQAPLIPQQAPTIDPSSAKIFSEISQNLANRDKTNTENEHIKELIKGTKFENDVQEFDSILKGIYKDVVRKFKGPLTTALEDEMDSQIQLKISNSRANLIVSEMIGFLSDKFLKVEYTLQDYEDNGETKQRRVGSLQFSESFYEIADKIFETKLNEFERDNIRSNLEKFYISEEHKDKEFWYNSDKFTQEVMNTLNELAKTNAQIETNLLNGTLTSETFFKALLIVLSKSSNAIPNVISNATKPSQKSTYQTTNNVYMPNQRR